MQETKIQENKMGIMPIPKLLITMSLPMMLSMLVQALYNIVDSVFVAQISENALTAVSLVFPIQNLMIAIAAGTGVGINSLVSRYLGMKDFETANKVAKNGVFLGVVSFLIFAIFGGSLANVFFSFQTDNPEIVHYGVTYMRLISVFSMGIFLQVTYERLMQSTGKTFYNMITQGTGALLNILLDPILIFGLFGFPRLEVMGAAIATIIGQFVALSMSFYFNHKKNTELDIKMRGFKPDRRIIVQIYEIGVPSIIMQSVGSVMVLGFNKILLMFSSTAAAVFGIYFKLQSFVFMPVFGLNNGLIPIVAYNYGAKNKKRITDTIKLSAVIAVGILFVGFLIFQIFTEPLLQLFDASQHMIEIGVPALRIISISFSFAGYCIVLGSVFQALGNGGYSLLVAVARQLLVILPVAYIFAITFGLHMVWWSYPIAEIASVSLSTLLFRRIYKKKIRPLENEQIN